jgi:hypothetical protein
MKQNCSNDLIDYDSEKVKLTPSQQKEMRERRNANRERLQRGLKRNGDPQPDEHIIQGSYAMKTMTQHPDRDYDIDDGSAFVKDKLAADNGSAMTPSEAKQMVCDALIEGGGLTTDPEVKKNCVRVTYKAGYHVDIPVYRMSEDTDGNQKMELAGEEWCDSNPREINDWYSGEESKTANAGQECPQLRRQTRLLKKYSRANLGDDSPSGLILTILAAESHTQFDSRQDNAFRELLRKVRARLFGNKVILNPANTTEQLSKETDEARINALLNQIGKSLSRLEVLDKPNCRRSEALRAWKDIFKTDYFDAEIDKAEEDEKDRAEEAVAGFPNIAKPWCPY